MKKVAVLGCSHSSYQTSDNIWTALMAEKNPHLDVHCYASNGHGTLWFDVVLKHLVQSEKTFDHVIVQFTGDGRWLLPIHAQGDPRFFIKDRVGSNYKFWACGVPRQIANQKNNSYSFTSDNKTYIGYQGSFINVDKFRDVEDPYPSLPQYFHLNFVDTFEKIYSSVSSNFHTFKFNGEPENSNDNNIKLPSSMFNILMSAVGDEKFATEYVDDSDHLTDIGNEHAYQILKNSSLGKILDLN